MWAEDIQDLKALGWTQVTELTDVENNYYVFVDAASGNYSIGRGLAAGDRPMSHVLGNPSADNSQVWILEASGDKFKMKNLRDNYYFNSGNAGWNDSMDASNGTEFTFTLNEGKYDISATTGYVGPWNNDNKVTLADAAENIAVNKTANQAPGYYVFAMSRTEYDAAKFGAAQLEAQGWTKATDIAAAAGSDKYVIFLEAKGGSLVISRNESGRPAYKSLGNPLYNKHELWTIEGDADNYALNSEASAQYLNAQDWNTGFGSLGDNSRRKFVSLGDGKYAIQNKSNTDYLGRWQNQESAPYEMENIAANKNEAQRGNYYVYYMSKSDYAAKRAAALTAATATTPADITDFIYNSRFSDLDSWGWQIGGSTGNRQFGSNAAECWNCNNLAFTQTLTGLPNGKYTVSVQAVNPDNGSSSGAKLVGNTTEKAIETNHSSNSYGVVAAALMNDEDLGATSLDVVVTDGTLEMGIKAPTGWVIFDNFKLTYQGEDLSDYQAAYATANSAAKAVDQNAPMFTDIKTALQTAISTYCDKEYSTVASIREAITALETATTNANASIQQYVDNTAALAAQKELIDGTNVYAAGWNTSYVATYNTKKDAHDNKTLNEALVNPNAATAHRASTAYNDLLTPWTIGGEACNNFDKALYINTWSTEGNGDGSNFKVPFFEYWTGDANSLGNNTISAQVTDLENGLYSVTAWVRVRAKNGVTATDATGINLSVNGGTASDATEGAQVGTSQFTLAEVTAEGLVKEGTLNIAFNIADANISWLSYKNVKYTKVRDLTPEEQIVYATAAEIADFNNAIATAEAKTIGFAAGEYAPYNNIVAMATLKAAKALDVVNPIDIEVLTPAKDALDNATWTANVSEVNAVYPLSNYNASSEKKENRYTPLGWSNRDNQNQGANYNTRIMVAPDANNAGLTSNALFAKYETSYGEQEGYTMPLKAGVYSLSFKHGGWGEAGARTFNLTCGGTTVVPFDANTANSGYSDSQSNAEHWATYNGKFIIPADGNYVFNLIKTTNAQNQIVISDLEIFRVPVTEIAGTTVTAANGWGTFISEIDRDIPTGMKAYSCAGVESNGQTLTLVEATEGIKANTPYILENTTSEDITIDAENGQSLATKDAYTVGLLTGVYASTPAEDGWYVLQNNAAGVGFYQVDTAVATPSVGANRCYLTAPAGGSANVRAFRLDNNANAIEAISAIANNAIEAIYNANGVKVNALQKGINVVKMQNGMTQKVLVK